MESILEQQRRYHEERERLIRRMVDGYAAATATSKVSVPDRINAAHRLKALLQHHSQSTNSLRQLYEDRDGERKSEIVSLSAPNEFAEFYARLRHIKDYHRRHPEASVATPICFAVDVELGERNTSNVAFSDEEGGGRYLDLHECFALYQNLRGIKRIDYIGYMMEFDRFDNVPHKRNSTHKYTQYLTALLAYLVDYVRRIRPLFDVDGELDRVRRDFAIQWLDGREKASNVGDDAAHLDLTAFASWTELTLLGLDRLKSALLAVGEKCGGSLEERAQRLFATKCMQRNVDKRCAQNSDKKRWRAVAEMEAQLRRLAELVHEQRLDTKENVQRRQARTEGNDENDDDDEANDDTEVDDDDDNGVYNPKHLPLGWDGKPIPYWLYKLNGLNISHSCEICGNFRYMGPKVFQRHFAEWRHAHGMRCLGIPNTAHFANVTQIEDAMALWERLKLRMVGERWQPEAEEEFEDTLGNVVNRKTYEDLKRQGLL